MMVMVRVRASHRWSTAQVSGLEFSKAGTVMPESALNDEIRGSALLEIEPLEPAPVQQELIQDEKESSAKAAKKRKKKS